MSDPKVADNKPILVDLEEGKTYYWCACGRSTNQPFCDGTHMKETDITPIKFVAEKDGKKALCMCKQSKNKPFCDGTHKGL